MVTFLRRGNKKFSKLGLRRKSKQVWRKPKGRDNKMREKKKGYPIVVSIGYGTQKTTRGMINEKTPVMITSIKSLMNMKKTEIGIIGNVGVKRKIQLAELAKKEGKELQNMNPEKYLNKNKIKGSPLGVPRKSELGGKK